MYIEYAGERLCFLVSGTPKFHTKICLERFRFFFSWKAYLLCRRDISLDIQEETSIDHRNFKIGRSGENQIHKLSYTQIRRASETILFLFCSFSHIHIIDLFLPFLSLVALRKEISFLVQFTRLILTNSD